MKLLIILRRLKKRLLRNYKTINGIPIQKHHINYEFGNSRGRNIGDTLTIPLIHYILNEFDIKSRFFIKPKHLYGIGSIICFGLFDAIIWGSGFLSKDFSDKLKKNSYINYDIRAVRGPLTKELLLQNNYNCPSTYGDPAILFKRYYNKTMEIKYRLSLITHYVDNRSLDAADIHKISVDTDDYKFFIDEIRSSKVVISSSLHGIILAETYGVPCIWLKSDLLDNFKYLDWYYSTGRNIGEIQSANTIQDAIKLAEKPRLPPVKTIDKMRNNILQAFPFDLYKKKKRL